MIRQSLVVFFVLVSVALRLLPHPWNMSPVVGISLFCGAMLPKRWALIVPLLAIAAGDLALGWLPVHLFGWAAVALSALIGFALRGRRSALKVAGASLAGSTLFFLLSNFGVWALGCNPGWYPPTLSGLTACYWAGIPFYRNMLFGDLAYSVMLFGSFALFTRWTLRRQATVLAVSR